MSLRIATLCSALACLLLGFPAPSRAQDPEPEEELPRVELSALRAAPAENVGRRVRFVIQVREERASWNPWITRFGSAQFRSWSAWSDDRMLWERSVWEDPCETLFARRRQGAARVLAGARPYDRFEVVGAVREVFRGIAWIEIESAKRLPRAVGEGSVLHASRALELMQQEAWERALAELERARTTLLPRHADARLAELIAEVEAELEQPEEGAPPGGGVAHSPR